MDFNVNNIGKVFGTGEITKAQNVSGNEKVNSIFTGGSQNKYIPNTKFTAEEQHVLGLMVSFAENPGNLLIEE